MTSPRYTIEGPVTGAGHVFGGFAGDGLAEHGYVEEEYFISGTAENFTPVGELTPDGRWDTRPGEAKPFTTRVIVHRPTDPDRFNGVVMCEWTNVSTFNDVSNAVNETFYRSGYVYAAVSAQRIGVDGLESEAATGLRRLQPERYSSLDIPGDSYSYDIFAAVARCLMKTAALDGPDMLPGLAPRHIIATGESQSAARLLSYVNAAHQHHRVFSAFLPCVMVGGGSELHEADSVPGETKDEYNRRFFSRIVPAEIRTDLDVPILVMQSETEARMARIQAQADNEWIRVWELAGSVHGSACDTGYRPDVSARDGVRDPFAGSEQRMVRFMPTMEAAGLAMVRWLDGGAPLAAHPRLKRGEQPQELLLDEHGNASGGLRLPEVEAPAAVFDSTANPAFGTRTPFPAEKLSHLYPDPADYIDHIRTAAEACVATDGLLPHHVDDYIAAAAYGPHQA